jgi:hypothetical protein
MFSTLLMGGGGHAREKDHQNVKSLIIFARDCREEWLGKYMAITISKTDKYYKKAPVTTQANNYRNFPDLKTKFKFLHRKCQCPPSPRHMPCAVVVTRKTDLTKTFGNICK